MKRFKRMKGAVAQWAPRLGYGFGILTIALPGRAFAAVAGAGVLPWDAPLSFGSHDVGGARSDASAEILHPAGPPPYPVVMVLSGCAGITDNERDRAIRLASWVSPPS